MLKFGIGKCVSTNQPIFSTKFFSQESAVNVMSLFLMLLPLGSTSNNTPNDLELANSEDISPPRFVYLQRLKEV